MDKSTNNTKKSQTGPTNISRVQRIGGERINNDWAYLNEDKYDPHESSDKTFNRNYRHRGLDREEEPEIDENDLYQEDEVDSNYRTRYEQQRNSSADNINRRVYENRKAIITATEKIKTTQKGPGVVGKRKAAAITRSIFWWGGYTWVFVQLPIAVLGTIVFAIIGGLSAVGAAAESNFITSLVKSAAESIASLLGFNVGPMLEAFFFITYILVQMIGLFTILLIFIQHSMAFNRPLSGNKAGLKIGALILAFIGYATPIVNILPWALPWVLVIGKYPR